MRNLSGLFFLSLGLIACGGARSTATTTPAASASSASSSSAVDAESADGTANAPCTSWDPSADPTLPPADVAAPPETARRGAAGLRFCIVREGEGERPTSSDTVVVHYTGWTTDGRMFDSSHTRGEPAEFPVTGVISGWTQALTHMRIGEVRRLWIPESLAYHGQAGMPQGMLVFDVELLGIR